MSRDYLTQKEARELETASQVYVITTTDSPSMYLGEWMVNEGAKDWPYFVLPITTLHHVARFGTYQEALATITRVERDIPELREVGLHPELETPLRFG